MRSLSASQYNLGAAEAFATKTSVPAPSANSPNQQRQVFPLPEDAAPSTPAPSAPSTQPLDPAPGNKAPAQPTPEAPSSKTTGPYVWKYKS